MLIDKIQQAFNWPYRLRRGHSDNPAEGACAMDAVSWLVHGKHGDAPECTCPVIAIYVIRGNDGMDAVTRQRLLPYLHRIAGSRSPQHEAQRALIAAKATVRLAPYIFAEPASALASHAALDIIGIQKDVDKYLSTLDAMLNAGPQGEAWSTDVMDIGVRAFAEAGGKS